MSDPRLFRRRWLRLLGAALLAGAVAAASPASEGGPESPPAAAPGDYAELAAAEAALAAAWQAAGGGVPAGFASRAAARFRQAELAGLRVAPGRAAGAYVALLEDEPPSAWTARARLGLADALLARGEWLAAAAELQAVLDGPQETAEDQQIPAAARRRLALVYRTRVRPAAGEAPWRSARRLAVSEEIKKPAGIAARDDGRLAVADAGPDLLFEVGPDAADPRRRPFPDPHRPAWDRLGDPVLAGSDLADERGRRLRAVRAALRGPLGEWLVAAAKPDDRVLLYTPGRAFAQTVAGPPALAPVDLALDPHGRLYFLDARRRAVFRFTPETGASEAVLEGAWGSPEALAVDAAGNYYVLDGQSERVEVYHPDGASLASLGPRLPGGGSLERLVDVAVDGAGRVYLLAARPSSLVVLE